MSEVLCQFPGCGNPKNRMVHVATPESGPCIHAHAFIPPLPPPAEKPARSGVKTPPPLRQHRWRGKGGAWHDWHDVTEAQGCVTSAGNFNTEDEYRDKPSDTDTRENFGDAFSPAALGIWIRATETRIREQDDRIAALEGAAEKAKDDPIADLKEFIRKLDVTRTQIFESIVKPKPAAETITLHRLQGSPSWVERNNTTCGDGVHRTARFVEEG